VHSRLPEWLRRITEIGTLAGDSEELRLRKSALVLSSSLMATLAFVWVATYAVLGLWLSAAIPLVYQLASGASLYTFARTRRYRLFRSSQLLMSLLLPFALQWSLGGFANSSAVALWAFTCPIGALVFVGARQAVPWFVAFASLVAVSGAIDPALSANAPAIPQGVEISFFVLNVLAVCATAYVLLQYFVRARERTLRELSAERAKSERLLLNVLPASVASRLKESEEVIADGFDTATVLFADIVAVSLRSPSACRPPRQSSSSIASSPAGMPSRPATASRRSRRSATPTWWLVESRHRGPTTPRRSRTSPSRWGSRPSAARDRSGCRSRFGSGSTAGRSSPG
jgi:adenylate cyclase